MSWRAREIKDRLMHSGGDRFIRKVKNASRRVGGAAAAGSRGRRAAKPGADLHYRGLQEPVGELEAVLDDLDTTSDPIFSGGTAGDDKNEQARPSSSSSSSRQHSRGPSEQRDGRTRPKRPPNPFTKSDEDPLFPSDGEDGPVTDVRSGAGEATGPTDSEESEDLDLDEAIAAAEVMESLHQLARKMGQEELFDSESPPSSSGIMEGEGGQEIQAVNNKSANNNTHIQEAGETLHPTATETLSSGGSLTHSQSVGIEPRKQQHYEPSLEELLEHGSAILPSRPYSSSPRLPHGSPRVAAGNESSSSPLTSSNESYPNDHSILSGSNQTLGPTTGRESAGEPSVKHVGFDSKPPDLDEQKGIAPEQAANEKYNLFPEPSAHTTTSVSPVKDDNSEDRNVPLGPGGHSVTSSRAQEVENEDSTEDGKKYSRDDSDELFPDDAKVSADSKANERTKPTAEDDLFPDDAKLLRSSEASKKSSDKKQKSDKNTLEIREDHFSPSPEEQSKNRPAPPPAAPSLSSQSPGKLNTATGKKTAPPRPPRSPKLDSRLKLRQSQQSQSALATASRTPPPPRRALLTPTGGSPEASARARNTHQRPLSSSPPTRRTIINETDAYEQSPNEQLQTKATSEPRDTLQSSVVPHSSQSSVEDLPPRPRAESVSDETEIDSVELPFLPLHVHLPLTLLLYFYYTLNPFYYLAGLGAGFLLFYLCLGALFVAYVQREGEESAEGSRSRGTVARGLSTEFLKSNNLQLEDYKTRFTAPSKTTKFEFTATLQYHVATHHRRDRLRCRLKLENDFELFIQILDSEGDIHVKRRFNLHTEKAVITIVPDDVFQNRKRRWSKKYPIRLEVGGCVFFLFSNVSRFKQEWFFRLRAAAKGTTTEELVESKHKFFSYMLRYISNDRLQQNSTSLSAPPTSSTAIKSPSSVSSHSMTTGQRSSSRHQSHHKRPKVEEGAVQFSSSTAGSDREENITEGSVSISNPHFSSSQLPHASITSTISSSSSMTDYSLRPSSARSLSNTSSIGPASPLPLGKLPSLESYWINAVSARIFWDVWHEERWKKWIVSRIERKLVRIKTPRFLDPLQLTDVAIGESMPVINRLSEGPYLKVDGVWVFFDVEYEGEFVMTIKTRLKLGHWRKEKKEKGTELKAMKYPPRVSHSHAAVMLQEESSGVYPDEDDSETGSEEEEEDEEEEEGRHALSNPLEEEEEEEGDEKPTLSTTNQSSGAEPRQPLVQQSKKRRGARLRKVVSNLTKRVTNNRLVRRAAERAVEKASNVPLELTVVVRKLKGVVAVNIPPPTSDTIWYGFQSTPRLDLVARPKLGKRAVTFSQITHWIERKLCSLVDEKLTLPNMDDLVVPVLNSGLAEDTQKSLS